MAGVLAFSVSARTREFGVRLAIGSTPRHLLLRVLSEGARHRRDRDRRGCGGRLCVRRRGGELFRERARCLALLPVLGAAVVLVGAAVVASLMPAARASRVDVLQALRSE